MKVGWYKLTKPFLPLDQRSLKKSNDHKSEKRRGLHSHSIANPWQNFLATLTLNQAQISKRFRRQSAYQDEMINYLG